MADVERPGALGALELVRAERHEVRAERLHVDVDVRGRLDGVDVEQDPLAAADLLGDGGDRLDRPDLVVGQHHRHQDRPVGQRRLELVRVDAAIAVDRQLDDLEPELLQVAERVPDGVVLHRRRDDPVAVRLSGPGRALQGEVVGLGAAGGEDDLASLRVESRRESLMGLIEAGPGGPAERVRRAGVAEGLGQVGQHRVEDLAAERGRRRVVEVDRHGLDRTPDAPRRPRRATTTRVTFVHAATGRWPMGRAAPPRHRRDQTEPGRACRVAQETDP